VGVAVPASRLATGTVVSVDVEELTRIRNKRLDHMAAVRTRGTLRAHGRRQKYREN